MSLGSYPQVSLGEARAKREAVRKTLDSGKNPIEEKKAARIAQIQRGEVEKTREEETFGKAVWSWFNTWRADKAPSNVEKIRGRLEKDVLPWLGSKPLVEVGPHDIYSTCARIQERGAIETAHRVMGDLDAIFKHVMTEDSKDGNIAEGRKQPRITSNPCANLRGRNVRLLQPAPVKKHFAHFKDERTGGVSPAKVGEYLRAISAFSGSLQVLAALKLAPMLFCRPGELRKARWSEIDLETKTWSFTVSKARSGEEAQKLVVPLPAQAIKILEELRPLTGDGEFVFAGHRDKSRPMSDAAVNAAIRRLGFDTRNEISGHGFRHIASTLLYEQGYSANAVEKSLGHKTRGVRGVYDHAQFLVS
jgi:integrase